MKQNKQLEKKTNDLYVKKNSSDGSLEKRLAG